jgi:hypothetical protein
LPKLHELLAVESPLKGQADKCRNELSSTLEKKRHLFSERLVTFHSNEEGKPAATEEQSALQSTIHKELSWISGIWSKALDGAHAIAEANTKARADVVLEDGTVLLTDVPATSLLELEKRATEIQELIVAIPPLDPAKGFTPDATRGVGIFQAREDVRTRGKKVQRALVLYEATKEHPAQVKEISVDEPVGEIRTKEWSGLITTGEKADMLDRIEQLARAIKRARSRANNTEVGSAKSIGAILFSYAFKGETPPQAVSPKSGQAQG